MHPPAPPLRGSLRERTMERERGGDRLEGGWGLTKRSKTSPFFSDTGPNVRPAVAFLA